MGRLGLRLKLGSRRSSASSVKQSLSFLCLCNRYSSVIINRSVKLMILAKMKLYLLLGLLAYVCLLVSGAPELTISSVDRTIDISSQLVQIVNKIKLVNTDSTPVSDFIFTIDPEFSSFVSFFEAANAKDDDVLKHSPVQIAERKDTLAYRIQLSSPLPQGKSIDLEVEVILTHYLQPFPTEITQKEKQLVRFVGNHYFFSPYKVGKQTTKFTLSTRNVESFSKLKPFSQSDNTISFGPYENVAPYSLSECLVHYENNAPFLTITKLERTIEVSHWGNIAVEEHIDILHTGAKLKGSFSRFDYQREQNSGINSIKAFKTILPASARDVYYRDDIGNISTSNMYVKHDSVEITLRPRFPLFGGWKTRYVLGYNLPSYEYLYTDGSHYALKMRLVDHIFDTMVVDEAIIKIILPEGCTDLQLEAPYALKKLPPTLHFTYLDITGRPVTTLVGKNLVESHIQDFTLEYNFPKIYLLREPLLVIFAFVVLFFTVLVYVRLDFSISSTKAAKSSANDGIVETVLRRHGKRATVYENLENQIKKLKANKDVAAFQAQLKTLSSEHKSETQAINEIVTKYKNDAPELAESILELQRLDRGFWELYQTYEQAVGKLVIGKLARQQFVEQENQFNRKRDELAEKLNNIVKNL